MTEIYKQHDAAFKGVSAYVIAKDGQRVATIAFKRAASGMRPTAYVHWIGMQMIKGIANGYGYDKATASVAAAARKSGLDLIHPEAADFKFWHALKIDNGTYWNDHLTDAGFTVWQAV